MNRGILFKMSTIYCKMSHPFEWLAPVYKARRCFEEQHIVQIQEGGGSVGNIAIVPISSHRTTDTWHGCGVWRQSKVWERRTSQIANQLTFSSHTRDGIFQAYKLGRYQGEYVFLLFNYQSEGCRPTIIDWDGISHFLYIVSWWVNFPSKYFRKLAYIIYSRRYLLILDHIILLPVSLAEGLVGTIYNGIGVILGTITKPAATASAIVGGLWLTIESILGGILDIPLTLYALGKASTRR